MNEESNKVIKTRKTWQKFLAVVVVINIILLIFVFRSALLPFLRASNYYGKGMFDEAISEANKAIQRNPNFDDAYWVRGEAYAMKHNFDQAIADGNKVIQLNPNFASAYKLRGYAYFCKENYDQAITDLTKAIEIESNVGIYYYIRANAYYSKHEYDNAWKDVYKAEGLGYKVPSTFLGNLKKYSGTPPPEKPKEKLEVISKGAQSINITLEGIFFDEGGKSSVLINGKIVFEGDKIGNIKIDTINRDSVDIIIDDLKKNIKIGQTVSSASK